MTDQSITAKSHTDITTEAAEWWVLLSDEDNPPSSKQLQSFIEWKNQDIKHANALDELQQIVGNIEQIPKSAAKVALSSTQSHRYNVTSWKGLAKTLVFFMVLIMPLLMWLPEQAELIMADKKTGVGEWQQITLEDNSVITLSSSTAINIDFTKQQRTITLLKGEVRVKVSHDSERAFVIQSEHGDFTALGTEFTVEKHKKYSVLRVIESQVEVTCKRRNCRSEIVSPGQTLRVYDEHLGAISEFDIEALSLMWQKHQLVVDGMPLDEVLELLSRYHHGYWSYDHEQLKKHHVSAVLSLDDAAESLALLTKTFPIKTYSITPYLKVIIDK
ncbi:hypothetical protein LCGC14_0847230 [marine sediment metagenome]|uniref:FecR protein domain-containing protein n=1 Tax=marine sediment metagenome TaxID=412755 RepID=A0A0F9PG50_9ZZZZ